MCTEPLYAIRLKTEFDEKFKRFGKRAGLQVIKSVREIGKDVSKLNYDYIHYDLLMISCGQCMQCRMQRVKQRATMSICEALQHKENSFITLTFGYPQTYSYYRHTKGLSHYLASKKAHFHEWSLDTETYQKFMKRLRNWYYNYQLCLHLVSIGRSDLVPRSFYVTHYVTHLRLPSEERPFLLQDFKPKKIRCMHCGEYGEKKSRSHHHAILFGFQFPDLVELYENNQKYYTSVILNKLWPFGIHRIGECNYKTCAYVSRYVTKKVNGLKADEYYNGRKPEYVTYSTKPVLGADYFIKNYKEFANTGVVSVFSDKKYECPIPRSYDNILKKLDKDLYNEIKEKRVTESKKDLDKILSSKRSIYSKLDDNQKITMAILRKLERNYEKGATNFNEYFAKAKAFGVNVKFFVSEFSENAVNYLSNKCWKSHQSKSSNADLHKKYYDFELARKRHINNCYQLSHSDERVIRDLCFYINMPNPYKCITRGRTLLDVESLDNYDFIDNKGKEYSYEKKKN